MLNASRPTRRRPGCPKGGKTPAGADVRDTEMPLEIAPGIVVDPKVRFGKPVVKGTRVPAELVVAKLAGGMTAQEVAEEYQNHPRGCARGSELRGRPPDRRRGPGDRLSVGVPGRRGHAALDGRRTAPGGAHSGRRSRCRPRAGMAMRRSSPRPRHGGGAGHGRERLRQRPKLPAGHPHWPDRRLRPQRAAYSGGQPTGAASSGRTGGARTCAGC
jgi:Protein of unknown function (DUF433)